MAMTRAIFSLSAAAMVVMAISVNAAPSGSDFVKKTISSDKIVIFSKSYCPYCHRAKSVFNELKQTFRAIELDRIIDGSEIQDALGEIVGRRTVPQVFINGKHIGGSDDTMDAYESGELAKLLGIVAEDDRDEF